MKNTARFRHFVAEFTRLAEKNAKDEKIMLDAGGKLLGELIKHDDWLPDECAQPHPQFYQQYLLYCDPLERFSVVSFVWGPGQKTPVHDHMTWGMVGMMRGAESCRRFEQSTAGKPMIASETGRLLPGEVDKVSPTFGDIHEVANAFDDRVSISIHVYGANIGAVKRHVFDAATGIEKPFVSGYSSTRMPNFWDRSAEVRASLQS
ncbi:MAG: cysteine dioxygenase [Burkholderiales bacterium]|nr:cysteine dioxygenase [Burkholderiales bacterium]